MDWITAGLKRGPYMLRIDRHPFAWPHQTDLPRTLTLSKPLFSVLGLFLPPPFSVPSIRYLQTPPGASLASLPTQAVVVTEGGIRQSLTPSQITTGSLTSGRPAASSSRSQTGKQNYWGPNCHPDVTITKTAIVYRLTIQHSGMGRMNRGPSSALTMPP